MNTPTKQHDCFYTAGATCRTGTATLPMHPSSSPVVSGVSTIGVSWSLVSV
jgi:hypothetical protein